MADDRKKTLKTLVAKCKTEANCTIKNNSNQDLLILPVVDAAVLIVW